MKRKSEPTSPFTRRDFLENAAAAAGAVALAGAVSEAAQAPARPWALGPRSRRGHHRLWRHGTCRPPSPRVSAARRSSSSKRTPTSAAMRPSCSGNVALGGGTSAQKKSGIVDSPDLLFSDLTDWSVVEPNGFPDYRYNDREIMRAFADNSAPTYEFLVAHGVTFVDRRPTTAAPAHTGNSAPRETHAAPMDWPQIQTGKPVDPSAARTSASGIGLIRPLEASARKLGVDILLKHR